MRRLQRYATLRRTVFIRDIDPEVSWLLGEYKIRASDTLRVFLQVSEDQMLHAFSGCGAVVDSRMCGDPNSALRFAFIEFDGEDAVTKARAARFSSGFRCPDGAGVGPQALSLSGSVMGSYSIKVVRSKTAIVPVNASLLPRTEEESERCKRTVYVTNIDLGVEVRGASLLLPGACAHGACTLHSQPAEVSGFFETLCGPVAQLHLTRLDSQGTQVAFVEFSSAHAADRALSCGGARLKVRVPAAGWCLRRCRCRAGCSDSGRCAWRGL
jgi:polyadenylate-binding protein